MIIFALSRNIDPQRVLILAGPVTSTAGMSSLEPVAAIVVAVLVGVHSREGGFDLEKNIHQRLQTSLIFIANFLFLSASFDQFYLASKVLLLILPRGKQSNVVEPLFYSNILATNLIATLFDNFTQDQGVRGRFIYALGKPLECLFSRWS